jgi:hypothetical protein
MSEKVRKLLGFAYFCLIALWFCGYLFLIGRLMLANQLFLFRKDDLLYFIDFTLYYAASQMILDGYGHSIYSPYLQLAYYNRLIEPAHIDKVVYLQYLPTNLLMLAPFAAVPMWLAYTLFMLVSVGLGWWAIVYLAGGHLKVTAPRASGLLLAISVTIPSWTTLRDGHFTWLLVAMCCFYCALWLKHRDILAGFVLSLIAIKPHYALFLAVPALARGRWRILFWAAFSLAAELAFCIPVFGWQNVIGYPSVLFHAEHTGSYHGVYPERMLSLRGLLSWFLPQQAALSVSMAVMTFTAAFLLWLWLRRTSEQTSKFSLGLTVVAAVLVAPHAHLTDALLLSIPAVLSLPTLSLLEAARLAPWTFRLWCLLLIGYPVFSMILFVVWEFFPSLVSQPLPFFLVNFMLFATGLALLLSKDPGSCLEPIAEQQK